MSGENLKKRKTYTLRLTRMELCHLRDLFSVLLPPSGEKTLSQVLAEVEGRQVVEGMLWRKLTETLEEAGIPMGDDAPDFIAAATGTPAITVYQIASDPDGVDSDEDDASIVKE